jgi:hypothetical protein
LINRYYGLKERERDYAQNGFTRIWSKISSFFGFMKASYKTLFLLAIVAIISVGSTTWVAIMLGESDAEVYLPSLGTIKTARALTLKPIGMQTVKTKEKP